MANLLEIISDQKTGTVTYQINGKVISEVSGLYDDQRKAILLLCEELKCNVKSISVLEDGTETVRRFINSDI